jgi:phosphorylcholine metabolism protein LicD
MITLINKRYPYLSEGVRIQYISREGATRSEIIFHRDKKTNIIVARDVLGRKKQIKIDKIIGYWPENVAPVSRNLRRLKDIKELVQQQLVIS